MKRGFVYFQALNAYSVINITHTDSLLHLGYSQIPIKNREGDFNQSKECHFLFVQQKEQQQ